MSTLTAANAILSLSITGLFDAPQVLQGFAADDVTDTETRDVAETLMGVDGVLSGGRVNMPTIQNIALQADSASNDVFDQWVSAQEQINDIYYAQGVLTLKSLGTVYTLRKGVLTKYPPFGGVKRIIQPRRFTIVWEAVLSGPT